MSAPRTVAFHTLGCKLNYSETSSIGRLFENAGYQEVEFENGADIYVINTCSVTDFADKTCRNIVRRALKHSSQAKIIVTGCYAQLKPTEIAQIPGVDLVLGASEKFKILDYVDMLEFKGLIEAGEHKQKVFVGDIKEARDFKNAFSIGDRTRSFLKVQDGCNYKCTFCTIPLARGASRSDTVENVLENVKKIADAGSKEIVLTGVNLGDFGNGTEVIEGLKPRKEALFFDLIKAIDSMETPISRFRISSIEPNLLTHEIIDFVGQSQRFVPHFHVPLQSGSNKILSLMRRRYQREVYESMVAQVRQQIPHCCIGVDVIVGFPGELDADFQETFDFLKNLDINYLHVFTYSERPNTPAADFAEKVPMNIRKERNERLRVLSEMKRNAFYSKHLGQIRPVLIEASELENGNMTGYTDNYIKISLPYNPLIINSIQNVRLLSFDNEGLILAELV